jgi:hypothetical protein
LCYEPNQMRSHEAGLVQTSTPAKLAASVPAHGLAPPRSSAGSGLLEEQ